MHIHNRAKHLTKSLFVSSQMKNYWVFFFTFSSTVSSSTKSTVRITLRIQCRIKLSCGGITCASCLLVERFSSALRRYGNCQFGNWTDEKRDAVRRVNIFQWIYFFVSLNIYEHRFEPNSKHIFWAIILINHKLTALVK